MKKKLPWILIAVSILGVLAAVSWPALRVAKLDGGEFISRLGALLVFALLIERTVEVFMTIWRAEESYKRQAEVQRLVGNAATDPAALKVAQESLLKYRAETQRWAMPITFVIGLMLAAVGVRVLDQTLVPIEQLVADKTLFPVPGDHQIRCYHFLDILLTAALLAGGADPIHKFMDAIRKFMEASSAKSSGTQK